MCLLKFRPGWIEQRVVAFERDSMQRLLLVFRFRISGQAQGLWLDPSFAAGILRGSWCAWLGSSVVGVWLLCLKCEQA